MWASMLGIQVIISSRTATASAPGMFNVPQVWHSDSDTVSTRSVSASAPGMFLRAPGVAQRLRHLHVTLSHTLPLTATAQ